jgi:hypothetical protein
VVSMAVRERGVGGCAGHSAPTQRHCTLGLGNTTHCPLPAEQTKNGRWDSAPRNAGESVCKELGGKESRPVQTGASSAAVYGGTASWRTTGIYSRCY